MVDGPDQPARHTCTHHAAGGHSRASGAHGQHAFRNTQPATTATSSPLQCHFSNPVVDLVVDWDCTLSGNLSVLHVLLRWCAGWEIMH
jgi:hypothetical protein